MNRKLILVVADEQKEAAKGVLSQIAQEPSLHFYFFGGYAWEIEVPGLKDMWNKLIFLIEVDETVVGIVQFRLDRQTLVATMDCAILKEHRRRGYGSFAAVEGMRYVFEQLGFRKVETGVHAENTESVRSHRRMMAKREGVLRGHMATNRLGEFADRYLYGITRDEFDKIYQQTKEKKQ